MIRRKRPTGQKAIAKMSPIGTILTKFDFDRDKYITREWQKFGYDIASVLDDLKNTSLYIKLAKTMPRKIMLDSINFVKDASNVRSRPRLFMWKLNELKKIYAQKK